MTIFKYLPMINGAFHFGNIFNHANKI